MRLPVRSARVAGEMGLRLAAMALLLWAFWLAVRPAAVVERQARVTVDELPERLREWTLAAPDALHVTADSLPDDSLAAWLVALRRAGTVVGWSASIAPLALSAEPVNAPAGGVRLLVAAPADSAIALRDAAGPLDTLRAGPAGAALRVPALAEPAAAHLGTAVARAASADSLAPGAVLLVATAGWEARYIVEALEESGWRVDARLAIAPGLTVRRGSPGAIDTARYAAVIALDSAAAGEGRRLAAYARAGGGVLLSGMAARLTAVREVAPGVPGARTRPEAVGFTADAPRRALGFFAIERVRPDAIVLERRGDVPVVAARRVGAGRVLQVGYDETWRWRMQGGRGGLEAHRRWWSDAVAATALRRATGGPSSGGGRAAAPRAAAFDLFGPPSPAPDDARRTPAQSTLHPWMLVASLGLLLAEWMSRRLRGAA